MTINDEQINILMQHKHSLIRQFERKNDEEKKLDEKTYNEEIKKVEEQLKERNKVVINNYYKEQEEINMAEEKAKEEVKEEKKVEEEKPKTIGKKVQVDSYASAIAKALGTKGVKNVNDAVDKVLEMKPGRNKGKLKSQIGAITREAKAGKGRWKNYTWNEEEYLLTPKE